MKVERLQAAERLVLRADEVPEGGIERVVALDAAWLRRLLSGQYRCGDSPAEVHFEARRDLQNVYVRGRVTAALHFDCSRCAEEGELALEVPWHVLFVSPDRRDVDTSRYGADLGEPDLEMGEVTDGLVDLEPAVREALVLSLPGAPRCKDDCAGLCAGCGENLNEGTCRCTSTVSDPRWAPLAALREKLDEKS